MSFTLAIVGRPNVGKSTLFNRLVGKKLALVDDQPGVTRDLREGEARLGDLRFTVIDTAGLEDATDNSLQGRMRRLTERAVEMADLCLFMIDARTGVTPIDEMFADILRRKSAHVILAANKGEGSAADAGVIEAYGLGLGEPIDVQTLGLAVRDAGGNIAVADDHQTAIQPAFQIRLPLIPVRDIEELHHFRTVLPLSLQRAGDFLANRRAVVGKRDQPGAGAALPELVSQQLCLRRLAALVEPLYRNQHRHRPFPVARESDGEVLRRLLTPVS